MAAPQTPAATALTDKLSSQHTAFAVSLAVLSAATLQQAAQQLRSIYAGKAPTLAACTLLLPASTHPATGQALHLAATVQPRSRKRNTSHDLVCSSGGSRTLLTATGLAHVLRSAPAPAAGWLTAGSAPMLQTIWLPWLPQPAVNAAAKRAKWVLLSYRQPCPLAAVCRASKDDMTAVSWSNIVFTPSGSSSEADAGQEQASVKKVTNDQELVAALVAARADHVFCVQRPRYNSKPGAHELHVETRSYMHVCSCMVIRSFGCSNAHECE